PRRPTAELPLLALPTLERGVLADGGHLTVGPRHGLRRVEQQLVVRAGAPGRPDFLTGLEVVRDQPAAHTVFTAGDTRDHLVLEDVRRIRIRLTDLRIAVLC